MGRAPCCDKAKVKRGPWSPEEDVKLKEYIDKHGTGGNWIALPQKAGLKRCGKSCRLRWLNYLRPNIKHGEFSDDEDRIICNLYANIGSRWSIIAGQLPGRTDNDIKNYWNTKLKKKLMGSLMVANSFTTPHHKMTMIPNNNNHQQCPILSSPSSYSSLLPPTLTYFNNIYTTPSDDVKPLIITGEKISNITSNYVNFQNQDQFLSCMHNYQEQESSANIKFGASAAATRSYNDHQQASAASCSSSDGSNCYINKDHVDYQQWMMFNNGGIDDQKQENVGMFNGNYQVVSDSLDYNVSSDLEEIRQLISTNNLSCNSSLNFFLDENKTTSYQEEKVEMYY